jgi:hypothetical protein
MFWWTLRGWLALRPRAPDLNVRERALTGALSELIREGRVQMIGAIRQELLSAFARKKSLSRCGIIRLAA